MLLEMGPLNGSTIEPGVEYHAPCFIVIRCYVVAGDVTVCGIEGSVHEMV